MNRAVVRVAAVVAALLSAFAAIADVPDRLRVGNVEVTIGASKESVLERLKSSGYVTNETRAAWGTTHFVISKDGPLGRVYFCGDQVCAVSAYVGTSDKSAFDMLRTVFSTVRSRFGETVRAVVTATDPQTGDSPIMDLRQVSWSVLISVPEKNWYIALVGRQGKIEGKPYEAVEVLEGIGSFRKSSE